MKMHRIEVTEVLSRVIKVSAENRQQALEIARRMYRDSEIVLDASDYERTEIRVKDEERESL